MYPERKRSNWWYLVPIFIGFIGGIIAYFAIRRDDPGKAMKCLLVGVGLTVINIMVNIVFFSAFVEDQFFSPNVNL